MDNGFSLCAVMAFCCSPGISNICRYMHSPQVVGGEWGQDGWELQGDDAECGKSRELHGMSQHSLRVLQDVTQDLFHM